MHMNGFRVVFGALLLLAASNLASAQTGRVTGRVANVRGGFIGDADVTLRALPAPGTPAMPKMANMPGMGGAERTAKTQADGTFAFDQVAAGQYVLQVDFAGFERSSQEVNVANQALAVSVTLQPLEIPGAEAAPSAAGTAVDTQSLLDRIKILEQRITDLESGTVLSEPETRVKRVEVYRDDNGIEYDQPTAGARKTVTYQRERVYRRQWLSEKLEQAFADQDAKKIAVGISAASVTQFARQTSGPTSDTNGHAYQLASADLLFSAGIAQYTSFFADIVGLSGAPPDAERHGLTLLNSYSSRLVQNNQVNVREAWVKTELLSQRLALVAGRVDMTNYFDRNAVANDETSQFVSDSLVNNPVLVLPTNGSGIVGLFDPKNGFSLRAGFQQTNADATNLTESIYTLSEVGYVARPPGLSEGNYRVWYRSDNSTGTRRGAVGVSIDQKLTPLLTLFGRYGSGRVDAPAGSSTTLFSTGGRFYSGGFQIQNGLVFNPLDRWGVGYARTVIPDGPSEGVVEGYYNFRISQKLRLSLSLQHLLESPLGEASHSFLFPGVRLQASF
jgi:carboxypeptidase family protein